MKRKLCIVLAIFMLVLAAGCQKTASPKPAAVKDKIAIITGSMEQDAQAYQAAMKMCELYGEDIVSVIYEDSSPASLARVAALAEDAEIKAAIIVQENCAVYPAIEMLRQVSPEMLILCGAASDDVSAVAAKADAVFMPDTVSVGLSAVDEAASMGATAFIHYSYAGLLTSDVVAELREQMIERCEINGIVYYDVTAPDPSGSAGLESAQQFIKDDVMRQIAQHGVDAAFFSLEHEFQAPLISAVFEQGAIFPSQSCQNPFCGYQEALGVDVSGREGDASYMLNAVKEKLSERGQQNRMAVWGMSLNAAMVRCGVEYAYRFIQDTTDGRADEKVLLSMLKKLTGGESSSVSVNGNVYYIMCESYDFTA